MHSGKGTYGEPGWIISPRPYEDSLTLQCSHLRFFSLRRPRKRSSTSSSDARQYTRMKKAHLKTENSKRCRSEVLWVATSLVFLQAGLAGGVHFWLKELRDPAYFCRATRFSQRIEANNVAPLTIVMLGSSRTAFGFRGGLVETELGGAISRPVVTCNL